jgi:transposase-like protein
MVKPDLFERCGRDVLAALLAGATVEDAAREHGVGPRTVARWLARGREEPGSRFGGFTIAYDAAQERRRGVGRGRMTSEEFHDHLDQAVRAGSIQAMKLWAELHLVDREEAAQGDDDPLVEVDEIARRRRQRYQRA